MKNIEVFEVMCRCSAGAEISHCAIDAAIMALQESRVVSFVHNDTKYTAHPNDLVKAVLERKTNHEKDLAV